MKATSNKEKVIMAIMGLAILLQTLFVFFVQGRYAFMLEDLTYSVNMATGAPLSSVGDIFTNIPYILKGDGGSVLSLSILELIILLGNTPANIINTLAMLIIAFVISRIVSPKRFDIMYMSMSFFMLTSLNSDWQYTYLWEFGVVNYVFPAIPFLVFLYVILKEVNYSENRTAMPWAIVAVVCAFLASWANPSYGLIVLLISIASIVICKRLLAKDVDKWLFASVIASGVGVILYMAAPGNYGGGSVMSGMFLVFSIFPAVVLALLMLAVSLRSGSFLSIGQILLTAVLTICVVFRFLFAVIPGISINGIEMCTLVVSITLFGSLFNNLKKDNEKNAIWGYILSAVALLYSVLVILEDMGGIS